MKKRSRSSNEDSNQNLLDTAEKATQKKRKRLDHDSKESSEHNDTAPQNSHSPDRVIIAKLEVHEKTGDIFDAPANTVIIHSCNCEGTWGAGIAKAFKQHYPEAFAQYRAECKENGSDLLATGLLIAPDGNERRHFVGCLFTSRSKGKSKDKPEQILVATKPAMEDLLTQIERWNADRGDSDRIQELRMCKINSGLFAVPWKDTRAELEKIDTRHGLPTRLLVVTRPE